MAQAFLETDFLLRRATPAPARAQAQAQAQAQATTRPAFVVRDPEPSRAATTARAQETRAQDTRSQTARSERDRPDVAAPPERAKLERVKLERAKTEDTGTGQTRAEKAERSPAPVPGAKATASADADPSGEAAKANAVPQGRAGAVSTAPAGVAGSPEAAMAATVLAGANPATKAGSADGTANDGEEKTDSADASGEEPDASLLALGVLPPPPPADPVLQANAGQGGQTSAPQSSAPQGSALQGEVRAGQGQGAAGRASSIAGRGLPSAGPVQSPDGIVQPSKGEGPVAAGQGPLARPGVSVAGTSDPALAVLDAAKAAVASVGTAALALPEGLSPSRESFDSVLAGFSAAPATAPAIGTSATAQPAQASTPASPPVPLGAVPMTIGLRSLQGSNHFEIRLDPGELGRIDVSLDIDKERGTVMAHLVVDRVETLALLQRDAGSLQQALSQAGLDAPEANINLSLRSDTQSGGQGTEGQGSDGRRSEGRPNGPGLSHQAEGRAALEAIPLRTLRGLTGLDIRI